MGITAVAAAQPPSAAVPVPPPEERVQRQVRRCGQCRGVRTTLWRPGAAGRVFCDRCTAGPATGCLTDGRTARLTAAQFDSLQEAVDPFLREREGGAGRKRLEAGAMSVPGYGIPFMAGKLGRGFLRFIAEQVKLSLPLSLATQVYK